MVIFAKTVCRPRRGAAVPAMNAGLPSEYVGFVAVELRASMR